VVQSHSSIADSHSKPHFKAEARLNNIQEFSPYLKENTTLHHYKDRLVNGVKSVIIVNSELGERFHSKSGVLLRFNKLYPRIRTEKWVYFIYSLAYLNFSSVPDRPLVRDPIRALLEYSYELGV
jgi:hypothetical protein